MKNLKIRWIICLRRGFVLLVIAISIAACNTDLVKQQPLRSSTSMAESGKSPSQTLTTPNAPSTATNTQTPIRVQRITSPTIENTQTVSNTLVPSFDLRTPTRTITEREEYFQTRLDPATNCEPPCWWGLQPGKTYWPETEHFFYYLGAPLERLVQKRYAANTVVDHFSNLDIFLQEQNTLLENILLNGSQIGSRQDSFQLYWKGYSPENVINFYGPPTRVLIWTEPRGGGDHHPFNLWLIYDDQSFMIFYSGRTEYGDMIQICPKIDDANKIFQVKIYLQSKESSLPLEQMGGWGHSDMTLNGVMSLEDATDISIDTFYKIFTSGNKPACIKTPAKIWKPIG